MRRSLIVVALAVPGAAFAAEPQSPPRIVVEGHGSVASEPDLVTITFTARGEGRSSDEAVKALVAVRQQADQAVASVVADGDLKDEKMRVEAVRGSACKGDDDNPRFDAGPCAIIGYVATVPVTLHSQEVNKAGTLTGLIARLPGAEPRLQSFSLKNPALAKQRALAAAMADARTQAEELARAGQVRLGRILSISNAQNQYGQENEIVVTSAKSMAPPARVITPVAVNVTPAPVETSAQVVVNFEIVP
jgi:uncharacterized protein YggE